MTVYIEYAFAQNFLLDGALLWLSFCAAKQKVAWKKLCFAATFGAVFALLFPMLVLPAFAAFLLKIAVGMLVCLLAYGRIKKKNEWGRYTFICALFFVFTFCTGGALTALQQQGDPLWLTTVFALVFLVLLAALVAKIYQKRRLSRLVFDCAIAYKQRHVAVFGFLDSGNLATKNGLPVCFLSPDLFYDLFGEDILQKGVGQVCVEVHFSTLAGEKTSPAVAAELTVEKQAKRMVYFAPSANMLKREYPLLLNGYAMENTGV